jgi:hypothetical protein
MMHHVMVHHVVVHHHMVMVFVHHHHLRVGLSRGDKSQSGGDQNCLYEFHVIAPALIVRSVWIG